MATALRTELTESQFAQLLQTIVEDQSRHGELVDLLREENPVYHDRGGDAIVRMRGWILLALSRGGVSDEALIFVLEELETGREPYLIAAAARVLRSYPQPRASFAPFVMRGIVNIRYRDDPVSLESYGEVDSEAAPTSPLAELAATLGWLGPLVRSVSSDIESLRASPGGLPPILLTELDRISKELSNDKPLPLPQGCCDLPPGLRRVVAWPWRSRPWPKEIERSTFEDQDGLLVEFSSFFQSRPAIVVFFFTRCDNSPQKCSLTVTKLARVQELLEKSGLENKIRTAAITYDPEFDDSARIRRYGVNRGMRLDENHRLLRPLAGFEAVREYFQLGVNYISSVVNRHRIEAFVVDSQGRIAAVFERLQWREVELIARARECLLDASPRRRFWTTAVIGNVAALAFLFFPKCPICWSAMLSMFGIAGLEKIPYAPWVAILLGLLMLINVASMCLQAWGTRRWWPVAAVLTGIGIILALKVGLVGKYAALPGIMMIAIGSVNSIIHHPKSQAIVKRLL